MVGELHADLADKTQSEDSRRQPRVALVAVGVGGYAGRYELKEEWLKHQWADKHYNAAVMEKALMIAGGNPAEMQSESKEAFTIADEFEQARSAPGGSWPPARTRPRSRSCSHAAHRGRLA